MQRFFHWLAHSILPLGQALGGPGIALISLLDSSFLTFPEVSDALIVVLTVAHPERWAYYGATATVGSVLGSLVMFLLARKSGDALLSRWVKPGTKDRLFGMFKRYGMLTVVMGSLMPPPMPLKPFVVLAGVTGVTTPTFLAVVAASRGFRYIGEAWLARVYGEQFVEYMNKNMRWVWIDLAILFVVGGIALLLWKRRQPVDETKPAP